MVQILSADQIDRKQWQELVDTSPTASFFQTPECYDFYCSLSFMEAFVYGVAENETLVGLVCGYIIADGGVVKRYFSRRAIVPGGALLSNSISENALHLLLQNLTARLRKKAIYIEFRNYNDYSSYRPIFENENYTYKAHLNFHIDTSSVDYALKNLSTTKRRDVKLSRKEGVEWFSTNDFEDIKAYYDILENLYKTKIKTPLFPFVFFECLVKQPFAHLFIVKLDGKVIGGSVCVTVQGKSVYEWFVCGLDGQIKNVFPSTVATWASIEFAAANNFNKLDMMGAGKPDEGYGVREFKSKFGGELVEHGRFIYICQQKLYALGKSAVIILKSR